MRRFPLQARRRLLKIFAQTALIGALRKRRIKRPDLQHLLQVGPFYALRKLSPTTG